MTTKKKTIKWLRNYSNSVCSIISVFKTCKFNIYSKILRCVWWAHGNGKYWNVENIFDHSVREKMYYTLIIYRPNYIYTLRIANLRREYALLDMSSTFLSMFLIALWHPQIRSHSARRSVRRERSAHAQNELSKNQVNRSSAVTSPLPHWELAGWSAHCHELRSVTSTFFSLFGRGGKLQRDIFLFFSS